MTARHHNADWLKRAGGRYPYDMASGGWAGLCAAAVLAAGMLAAAPVGADNRGLPAGRSTYRLEVRDLFTDHINYVLYVPPKGPVPTDGWPLILFLHGSEQRGDDPAMLRDLAILSFAHEDRQFPFVAVVPQCPSGQHWSPSVLKQLLDFVETSVPVDRSRVYLTGFSMGDTGPGRRPRRCRIRSPPSRRCAGLPTFLTSRPWPSCPCGFSTEPGTRMCLFRSR